jgi:Ca-activated chloride channel family protein
VILATDGDFNLGHHEPVGAARLIERTRTRDLPHRPRLRHGEPQGRTLELLADRGNGNYAYIDDLREARKVLVEQIGGTLVTIAKDVKIQVEFNPRRSPPIADRLREPACCARKTSTTTARTPARSERGASVTALYEIVPARSEAAEGSRAALVDPLKYQAAPAAHEGRESGEMFTLKLRYKEPDGDSSRLLSFPVADSGARSDRASGDFKLRGSRGGFQGLMPAARASSRPHCKGRGGSSRFRVSTLASQGPARSPGASPGLRVHQALVSNGPPSAR